MANVYGYRVGIQDDLDNYYYTDRGYIFADNQLSAVDKLFNAFKGENIYHFEIFEFTFNENDVFSIYTLLSESGVSKTELASELKDWSLI